jgi:transcriptional antiterminator
MSDRYHVIKILNNNCIIVTSEISDDERVLTGKGIGFGMTVGKKVEIPKEKIERYYVAFDEKLKNDFLRMTEDIDRQVLEVCTEVILMAEDKLGKLNSRLHLVLTDHISFAIERLKMDMEIHNPFLHEIKNLYKEEYQLALEARALIEKKMGIVFNEDEAGFIALHLYSARQNLEVKETLKNTRVIKELVQIIESNLGVTIDNDLTYNRLVNHLRGAIERSVSNLPVDNPLLEMLKKEFAESYSIAVIIQQRIYETLELEMPEAELGYMTIHIDRVRRLAKMKNAT